jgi:hypothetical protein
MCVEFSFDRQLGVPAPTTLSQRDVPGMTRAILPVLERHNVSMISIGSGGATGGHPIIPDLFIWRDEATQAEAVVVHDHGYGGGTHILPVASSGASTAGAGAGAAAIYCAWNRDNTGPLPSETVLELHQQLRYQVFVVWSDTV